MDNDSVLAEDVVLAEYSPPRNRVHVIYQSGVTRAIRGLWAFCSIHLITVLGIQGLKAQVTKTC